MTTYKNGTWLDAEEKAYNSYSGAASQSNRRCKAVCADGRVRTFKVGIPDTVFTIPAIGKIKGKYVSGYVYVEDDCDNPTYGTLHFNIPKGNKNRACQDSSFMVKG